MDREIVVVGAGPIGLEMGIALKRRGLDFCILEAEQIGHTVGWYAPGTHFFSSPERIAIAGLPLITRDQGKATREEYLDYLMAAAWQYELPILSGTRLVGLDRPDQGASSGVIFPTGKPKNSDASQKRRASFSLRLQRAGQETRIQCRYLILAVGDMHGPRNLGIPGENQSNVDHYLRELRNYFRQKVVIVGGRNSAVEAAIRIFRMGGQVTMVYRGAQLDDSTIKYWLYPEIQSMIKNGIIGFIPQAEVESISGNEMKYRTFAGSSCIHADQFLLLTGYEQDSSFLENLGLDLQGENNKPIFDESTMEASIPGVFIAGTATAGSQHRHTVFIENSHLHVDRILKTILESRKQEGMPDSQTLARDPGGNVAPAEDGSGGGSPVHSPHRTEDRAPGIKNLESVYREHPES